MDVHTYFWLNSGELLKRGRFSLSEVSILRMFQIKNQLSSLFQVRVEPYIF